MWVRS